MAELAVNRSQFSHIDWVLLAATIPIIGAGLVTMHSFGVGESLFLRQAIWVLLGIITFLLATQGTYRFLRRQTIVLTLLVIALIALVAVIIVGSAAGGAQSWFDLGPIRIQPSDPAKLVIITVLAKYFDRRHALIHNFRHVFVSGIYTLLAAGLIFLQPDFGSALIIAAIWFGMLLVAGVSLRHVMVILGAGAAIFLLLWALALTPEQQERITAFIEPTADLQGAGYNAHQSMVAVGSGQIFGKGVGYGTQSRLEFLPEYETDFIFAAFAEEWGLVGLLLLLSCYGIILWRILKLSLAGETSFERLFGAGVFIYLLSHIVLHVGINIGLLPVTGTTLPFMSYGGSHVITEFLALGILVGMQQYRRSPAASQLNFNLLSRMNLSQK